MKKILVIDSSVIGPSYIEKAVKNLGYEVLFITNIYRQEGDALKGLLNSEFIHCDTDNIGAVRKIVNEINNGNLFGITTFLDSKLELAAILSKELNLCGLDSAVIKLKDKCNVYKLIPEYCPKSISYTIGDPKNNIYDLFEQTTHGLIIKPAFAAGGKGVRFINNKKDIDNIDLLYDSSLNKILRPEKLIIQQNKPGKLVSIEGYVCNKNLNILGFTGRKKIFNSESAFIFPYDDNISNKIKEEAIAAIRALSKKAGYLNGFFHTEFIVDESNCYLIDANFGRIGGANIPEIIACSYHISPEQVYQLVLEVTLLGQDDTIKTWPKFRKKACGIAYGVEHKSYVYSIKHNLKHMIHTKAQNNGDEIVAFGESNWAWVGLVAGDIKYIEAEMETIKLHTNDGWVKPIYCLPEVE